jgi:hypothetical protein
VKSAHLAKVEARRQRVQDALLPGTAPARFTDDEDGLAGTGDPRKRLRTLMRRIGWVTEDSLANVAGDVWTLLYTDVPELIAAVRAANSRDPQVCRYCGETWAALLVPAAQPDPGCPGSYHCRDADGCEIRVSKRTDGAPLIPYPPGLETAR